MHKEQYLVLEWLRLISYRLSKLNQKVDSIMANMEERFTAIETKLDEASAEFLALVEEIRNIGVPPAAEAVLVRLEAKATALANVVDNVVPNPEPMP